MENFIFEPHPKNCLKFMVKQIKNATNSINLITLRINFKYKVDNEMIGDLLLKKSKEGVKVNIILNKYWSYLENPNQYFNINENLNIIYYEPTDSNIIIKLLLNKIGININNCCNNSIHVRLFVVDDTIAMVGNCDFLEAYNWEKKKLTGLIFENIMIEYGIIFKPDQELINYVKGCFIKNPDFQVQSDKYVCNGNKYNTHIKKLFEFIDIAEDFIFIDNQIVSIIGMRFIFNKLLDKFIKKFKENKDFKVIIVFNKYLKDNFNVFNIFQIYNNELTLYYFYNYLLKNGVDKNYIYKNWIMFDSYLYQTHNKLLIVDDKYGIYGSANLYFRSWIPGEELEFSLVLKGDRVKKIRNQIEYYFLNTKNDLSYHEILSKKNGLYCKIDNSYHYYRLLIICKFILIFISIIFFV